MPALPFDTILHIGAGTGAAVPDWLAMGVQRVILVEPNPTHFPALAKLAAQYDEVQVIEAAIAGHDGEGLLRVFNLTRHSSLSNAAGLTDLLPGLRQVALVPVALLTPATLLARLGVLPGSTLLMLDAPGVELPILQGLRDAGAFDWLTAIELVCTEEPQYDGSTSRAALQAVLEDADFALTATDLTDPDWPRLSFRMDLKARQVADLTAQLQTLRAAAQTLNAQIAEQSLAAETLAEDHARIVASLQEALQAALATNAVLTADLATMTATVRDLELVLPQAMAAKAALDQKFVHQRDAVEAVQQAAARDAIAALTDEMQAQIAAQSTLAGLNDLQRLRVAELEALIVDLSDRLALAEARNLADQQAQATDTHARAEVAVASQTITLQAERIKELEFRQILARDELRRSEGQLDLIKDLLLRGERL